VKPTNECLLNVRIANVEAALSAGTAIKATIDGSDDSITLHHNLSQRQMKILMAGGAINWHDKSEPGPRCDR
jgi:hypothetical protein